MLLALVDDADHPHEGRQGRDGDRHARRLAHLHVDLPGLVTNVYDFSMPLPEAVGATRFHLHQLLPENTIIQEPYHARSTRKS